ncbi:hypothetical protein JL722_12435 [Aureococcus anophagefferens]|nr:hypothetical protein JL722_12435 [Aureococcus anophagefferens]
MADFAALAANAKKAPNVKNAVLLLKHMRAHKVRRSDLVVTYGGIALRNAKRLGDDAWAPKDGGKPSARVERLKGLVAEARGDWDGALAKYAGSRGERRNAAALKREICVLKGKGAAPAAVAEALNGYVHYHRRLGELYYSLAAANAKDAEPRYRHARKYFAKSLELRKAATRRDGPPPAARSGPRPRRQGRRRRRAQRGAGLRRRRAPQGRPTLAPAELQAANAAVLDAHAPPYARLLPAKDADPQ